MNPLLPSQWFPLEGVQNGEVHLKLQWFSLQTDPSLLTEVTFMLPAFLCFINVYIPQCFHQSPGQKLACLNSAITVFQSTDGFACAMLAVYLDNASNLPVSGFLQGL